MLIKTVGTCIGIDVSYSYLPSLPDGSRNVYVNTQGVSQEDSGAVYEYALSLFSPRFTIEKVNTATNRALGYRYVVSTTDAGPDAYPDSKVFSVEPEKTSFESALSFKKKQLAGLIVASDYQKGKAVIKFTRGNAEELKGEPFIGSWDGQIEGMLGKKIGSRWIESEAITVKLIYQEMTIIEGAHPYQMGFPVDLHPLETYQIDSGVVTSALASAESGIYDLLTEIVELPSTLKYLSEVVQKGAKALKNYDDELSRLKKLMKKGGKIAEKAAKTVASLWLQYRYVLMPILYSIEDVKSLLKGYKRVFAKYREKSKENIELPVGDWDTTTFGSKTKRCWIKRSFSPEDLVDMLLGTLGLNPIATAWELVTLSFVVDWFINIGDVLTAATGSKLYTQQVAAYSEKDEGTSVFVRDNFTGRVEIDFLHYKRQIIEPRDHIGLQLQVDMNWKRWLDAIALSTMPALKILKGLKK